MPRRTRNSVDADERRLCELVVEFANRPLPEGDGLSLTNDGRDAESDIYERFAEHPYVRRTRISQGVPMAEIRQEQAELRQALVRIAGGGRAARIRETLRIENRLTTDLDLFTYQAPYPAELYLRGKRPIIGDVTVRLPLGELAIRVDPERGIAMDFLPWLQSLRAIVYYGFALLLDERRGLGSGLEACRARRAGKRCGNVFWRTRGPQRYCEDCIERVKVEQSRRRQKAWRDRQRLKRIREGRS